MTERERLQWLVDGIRSSVDKTEMGCYDSLEYYLLYPAIYDFDLNKNRDRWNAFKKALQEHYLLEEGQEAWQKLNQPDMVKKGYWWYDPQNWK